MKRKYKKSKGKKPEGWEGEPTRHGLAGSGVETVINDKWRFNVNDYVRRDTASGRDQNIFEGSYNSLDEAGQLIRNPQFLLSAEGSEIDYGKFRPPTNNDFEYLVYRTHGLTFGEVLEYLEENEPIVEVKLKDEGDVEERHFQYDSKMNSWKEIERTED